MGCDPTHGGWGGGGTPDVGKPVISWEGSLLDSTIAEIDAGSNNAEPDAVPDVVPAHPTDHAD